MSRDAGGSCTRLSEGRLQNGEWEGNADVQTTTILSMIRGSISSAEAMLVTAPMARM